MYVGKSYLVGKVGVTIQMRQTRVEMCFGNEKTGNKKDEKLN